MVYLLEALMLGALSSMSACDACEPHDATKITSDALTASLRSSAPSEEAATAPPLTSGVDGWVRVEPGGFRMGSPPTEPCRGEDEAQADVTLTRPLSVSRGEVTQRMFMKVMGYNPSLRRGCEACPVDSVTHHEAVAYCEALSRREGLSSCSRCEGVGPSVRCERTTAAAVCQGYRLPTEAEWECAARAKTRSATFGGRLSSCMASDEVADRIAWYKANSRGQTRPVGGLTPNRWGLYDMAGNVYEWTADWYAPMLRGGVDPIGPPRGQERVLRGGSWYHNAEHARSAHRYAFRPDKRLSYVGFRCVRTIKDPAPVGAE